ncbi:MAG: hypothetical protein ACOYNC_05065 [Bacteroidales bacterium]
MGYQVTGIPAHLRLFHFQHHQGISTIFKTVASTVSFVLVICLNLLAQNPGRLPFFKDTLKPDLQKKDLCLNSVKYKSRTSRPNDSVTSGKNFFILPEYEGWLVWWNNYNYLSENKIQPGFFHSPSLAVKYGKYTYKLSFQVAENVSSAITASINTVSFISLQASSDLVSSETEESNNFTFDSKVSYGRLRGQGAESYYADTINFQVVYNTFDIDSKSLIATFLVGFNGRKPWFGLRFINYNTPAYQVGKEVVDPRNPNDTLIWADVKDTKFTHFFLIVDPLALAFPGWFTTAPCKKKTQLKLQGHCYTMFGLGYAKNDTIGTVMTTSFPFQATRSLSTNLPFGLEADLGLRLTTRIGKHRNDSFTKIEEAANFRTAVGFRYTNWSIISFIKNDLQLRSNEFYWGPYLMLAIQF